MRITLITLAAFALAAPLAAEDLDDDPGGTLNPPELGVNRVLQNVREGDLDMMTCASGYYSTKSGNHLDARELFEACAAAGWTRAMTWMSQLDDNGLGADENPDAAADWDRRSAELGDPVGKFNYGLDLMRGRGVPRDVEAGKALVDEAAADGLKVARRLQDAEYDLDEVTPDADNWKYAPLF